ncbi:MAG TPA: hypothetical protein VM779_03910 [Thermoanaerobaculia bacterium]|nr:hypothetical protein [Thermoanaerobaculia bacterium]
MSNYAQARAKTESLLSASYVLPSVLAVNTVALFALDRVGGIPHWIKTAAALFLAF